MNRADWNRSTTADEAARRAGGRRRHNVRRQLAAFFRRRTVFAAYDQGASIKEMAAAHGVTPRTIRRDLQRRRRTRLLI